MINDDILVSVILPFFNGKEFIKETLESLKAQTFRNFEVLVIDDGSTKKEHSEHLKSLIASLDDPRFVYHHKENGGLSNARNYGTAASKGAWIAFIDQDDLWDETKLERQAAVAKNGEAEFIFTDGKFIGDRSESVRAAAKNGLKEGPVKDAYTRLLKGNFVICSSALFNKSAASAAGPANPCFKICPDYEHVIRIAEHVRFYFINAELVSYRIHGGNTVRNQLKQSAEVISLLCDRKIPTARQKCLASYNLARNILTLCRCWIKRLLQTPG